MNPPYWCLSRDYLNLDTVSVYKIFGHDAEDHINDLLSFSLGEVESTGLVFEEVKFIHVAPDFLQSSCRCPMHSGTTILLRYTMLGSLRSNSTP